MPAPAGLRFRAASPGDTQAIAAAHSGRLQLRAWRVERP